MVAKTKKIRGQAAIEAALALPMLIYLLYYTLNAFQAIHTSHTGQKYAAMNLYQRLDNRSKFAVDDIAQQAFTKTFMAVQYTNVDQTLPGRRILLEHQGAIRLNNVVGICREPMCN
jgi:Flp pilus assembly protein TadG